MSNRQGNKDNSIIMFIPYFGKWPEWMSLYVETLKQNSTIDFLIYTDCDTSLLSATNIRFRQISFDDYVQQINTRLQINFSPPNAYKLCDVRPMFGFIHQEEFDGYDHYGWLDLDLFLGDIRSFYNDNLLNNYEVFSTHDHRISGHFSLFKNIMKNRLMFRKIYRWKEALMNPEFVGIDEHGITNAYTQTIFNKFNDKFKLGLGQGLLQNLSRLKSKRMYFKEQYTTPFLPRPWIDGSLNDNQPDEWFYKNGEITNSRDKGKKFIYLHFMNFKSDLWRHDNTPAPWAKLDRIVNASADDMKSGIAINRNGIFPMNKTNEG